MEAEEVTQWYSQKYITQISSEQTTNLNIKRKKKKSQALPAKKLTENVKENQESINIHITDWNANIANWWCMILHLLLETASWRFKNFFFMTKSKFQVHGVRIYYAFSLSGPVGTTNEEKVTAAWSKEGFSHSTHWEGRGGVSMLIVDAP